MEKESLVNRIIHLKNISSQKKEALNRTTLDQSLDSEDKREIITNMTKDIASIDKELSELEDAYAKVRN